MYIHDYGSKDLETAVLLAPMMVSGEDLYKVIAPHMRGDYRYISPDLGGHGKAGPFVSADAEYAELKKYLLENGIRDIRFIYGASLGVTVGYRLFMDKEFNAAAAWFDGVALSHNAAIMDRMMAIMFRSRKKKLAKTKTEASPSLVEVYGYDFARMMTANFSRITLEDIDSICCACCHYDLRALTAEEQKRLHLDYGEKDPDLKLSRRNIRRFMPEAELKVREGYSHCGFMAKKTEQYVRELEDFVEKHTC